MEDYDPIDDLEESLLYHFLERATDNEKINFNVLFEQWEQISMHEFFQQKSKNKN